MDGSKLTNNADSRPAPPEPYATCSRDVEQSRTRENLLQVRTYDCFISYDKHYQTPRFWLLGYDEVGRRTRSVDVEKRLI